MTRWTGQCQCPRFPARELEGSFVPSRSGTMSTTVSPPYTPDARFPAIGHLVPGLLLSGAVAAAGMMLGRVTWLQSHGFSALTLAIVLGMIVGNTVYPRLATVGSGGVDFAKQRLLRLGVVLYG